MLVASKKVLENKLAASASYIKRLEVHTTALYNTQTQLVLCLNIALYRRKSCVFHQKHQVNLSSRNSGKEVSAKKEELSLIHI